MTAEAHNPAEELARVIAAGGVSEDAVEAITGVPAQNLRQFLDGAQSGMLAGAQALSPDETARLSILSAHLTEGLLIDDDERLAAIVEGLTGECRLTPENIATLTGVDVSTVAAAVRNPSALSADSKYRLAIRGSYLVNAVNQARAR